MKGEEIILEIQDTAFEGKCIARSEGLVVFVENAVPGDIVIAKLLKIKKSYAEAKAVRIERPSPLRVEPRCKYFGVCGGCAWQHVDYQAQLRFKHQHVVDSFERIGGFSNLNILPIIGSDDIYFYRNKMEYSFSKQQWLSNPSSKSNEGLPPKDINPIFLGLHVPQRYDKILDIDECHLQSSLSNRILNFTRDFARQNHLTVYDSTSEEGYLRFLVIRESKRTKEVMVNLVTYKTNEELMGRFTAQLLQDTRRLPPSLIRSTQGKLKLHLARWRRFITEAVISTSCWEKIRLLFLPGRFSRRMWHRLRSYIV